MEDFKLMKRRQLQDLCKKHGLPANLKNVEMADNLAALLNKKEEMEDKNISGSSLLGTENAGAGLKNRAAKKVRFSPSNEVFEVLDLVTDNEKQGRADRAKRRAFRKGSLNDGESSQPEIESSQELPVGPQVVRMTRSNKGIVIRSPPLKKKVKRGGNEGLEIGKDLRRGIPAGGDLGKYKVDEVVKCDELRPRRRARGRTETESNQGVASGTVIKEDRPSLHHEEAARKSSRVAVKRKSDELDEQEIGHMRITRNHAKKRSIYEVTKEASNDLEGAKIEERTNVTGMQKTRVPTRPSRRSRHQISLAAPDVTSLAGLEVNTLNMEQMNGNDENSKEDKPMARPVRRSRRKVPGNDSMDMEDGSSVLGNAVQINRPVKIKQHLDLKKGPRAETDPSSMLNASRLTSNSSKFGPAEDKYLDSKADCKKRQRTDAKRLTRPIVTLTNGTKTVPEDNVLVKKCSLLEAERVKCSNQNVPEENVLVEKSSMLEAEDEKCSNQSGPEGNVLVEKSSVLAEDEKCSNQNVSEENVLIEKSSVLEAEDENCSSQNVQEENVLVEKCSMLEAEDEKCSSPSDCEIGAVTNTRSCAQTDTMTRLEMYEEVTEQSSITSSPLVVGHSSASRTEDAPGSVLIQYPSAPELVDMLLSTRDGVEVEAVTKSNFSDLEKQTAEQIDASAENVLGCHQRHEENQYSSLDKSSPVVCETQRDTLCFETKSPDRTCEESAWEDDQGGNVVSVRRYTVLSTKPERSNLRTSLKGNAEEDNSASFHGAPAENASEGIIYNQPITIDIVTSHSPQPITVSYLLCAEEDFQDVNYGAMFGNMFEEPTSSLPVDIELSIKTKDECEKRGSSVSWGPPSDSVTTSFIHDMDDTRLGSDLQAFTSIQDGKSFARTLPVAEEVEVPKRSPQKLRMSPTADSIIDDYFASELSCAKRMSPRVDSPVDMQVPCQELATEDLTERYPGNVATDDVIMANVSALSPSQVGMGVTNTDRVDRSIVASYFYSDEDWTANSVKETDASICFPKEKELQGEIKVDKTDVKEYLNDFGRDSIVEIKEGASLSLDGPDKTLSNERISYGSPKPESLRQTDEIFNVEYSCSDTERNWCLDNNNSVDQVFTSAEKTGVASGDYCYDDNYIRQNSNMDGSVDDYYTWMPPFGDSSLSSNKTVHITGHKFSANNQLITEELNQKENVEPIPYLWDTDFVYDPSGLNKTEEMPGDSTKEPPHCILTCTQKDAKVVNDVENNVDQEIEGPDTVNLETRKQMVVDVNRIDELLQDIDDFIGDETASNTNDGDTTVATQEEVNREMNTVYQTTEGVKKTEDTSGSADENILMTNEHNAEPVADKCIVTAHSLSEEHSSQFDTYKEVTDVMECSTKAVQGNESDKSAKRDIEFDDSKCDATVIRGTDTLLASSLEGGCYQLDGSTNINDNLSNLWIRDREYGNMKDESAAHESCETYENLAKSSTTPPKPVNGTEKEDPNKALTDPLKYPETERTVNLSGNDRISMGTDMEEHFETTDYNFKIRIGNFQARGGSMANNNNSILSFQPGAYIASLCTPPNADKDNECMRAESASDLIRSNEDNLSSDNRGLGLTGLDDCMLIASYGSLQVYGTELENAPVLDHCVEEDPSQDNRQPETATDEFDSKITVELQSTTTGHVEVSFNVLHHELAEDSQVLKAEDDVKTLVQSEAVNNEVKSEETVAAANLSNTEILKPFQGFTYPDTQMTPKNQMSNQKAGAEATNLLATELNFLSNSEFGEQTQGSVTQDAQLTPQDRNSNQEPAAKEYRPEDSQLISPSYKISYTARKTQKVSQVLKENITPFFKTAPALKATTNSVAKRRALDHLPNQNH